MDRAGRPHLDILRRDVVVRLDSAASADASAPRGQAGEERLSRLAAEIRRIVASVDPNQPIGDIQPLEAIVDGETAARAVQVRSLLVGVTPTDALSLASAVGVSVAMTLAGSLLPAIRAARISPAEAMRAE